MSGLEIVYRDDRLIAINKPSGLLVHRSEIDRHETRFAIQLLRDQIGQRVYPLHRLDKPTSGVLLFALDRESAGLVGTRFQEGSVEKRYLAVVRGYLTEAQRVEHAFRERADRYLREPQILDAVTEVTPLAHAELETAVGRYPTARYSLLELRPVTGRRHQLRRHMKHLSHHILGDTTYGDGRHNRLFRERFGCHRLLLAATHLRLPTGPDGAPLAVTADLRGDFLRVVEALGWAGAVAEHFAPHSLE